MHPDDEENKNLTADYDEDVTTSCDPEPLTTNKRCMNGGRTNRSSHLLRTVAHPPKNSESSRPWRPARQKSAHGLCTHRINKAPASVLRALRVLLRHDSGVMRPSSSECPCLSHNLNELCPRNYILQKENIPRRRTILHAELQPQHFGPLPKENRSRAR